MCPCKVTICGKSLTSTTVFKGGGGGNSRHKGEGEEAGGDLYLALRHEEPMHRSGQKKRS